MKSILLLLLFFVLINNLYSQTAPDTLSFRKSVFKSSFYKNGDKIDYNEFKKILKTNPESSELLIKSESSYSIGWALFVIGTAVDFAAVMQLVNYKNTTGENNRMSTYFVVLGGGLLLNILGISGVSTGDSYFKKAVKKYNRSQSHTGILNDRGLNLCVSGNGVGLIYRF